MRKIQKLICSLVIATVFSTAAAAQVSPAYNPTPMIPGANTNIVVRGPGGASCSMYISSPAANRGLFIAWVQGFLTAYNQYLMGTGDIAGNFSNEQIIRGLDNYCRTYPQDSFHTAMSRLIETFKGAVR